MDSNNILIKVGADITNFSRNMAKANGDLKKFSTANKETFESFKKVGAVVTGAGVAIAAGLGGAVKVASDYQSAFAGVRKTTDATEKEFAVLSQGIRNMAKEMPASANEIANVAEVAGQLGIKKGDMLEFTKTMVNLGVATNMSSEEAATSLARLANITQMPMDKIENLGSTVVALGNNLATTEGEIVAMSLRLAGMGAQVGMSEADIAALAGAMSSVGIEAEAGGTAMSTVMKKINTAVANGGGGLAEFAEAAGVSSQEFADAWKNDPVMALDTFIKGLARSGEEGENLSAILGFMGIKGIREQDTLLRLAGASDILSDSVNIATKAWDENSALSNEAAERYKTLESKLSIFGNVIKDIGISVGNVLMPYVTAFVDKLTELGTYISNLNPKFLTVATIVATVASAFMLIAGPLLLLIGFIPQIITGFGALATVFGGLGSAFAVLTGPIGIAIAAIAGIIAVLVLAYNKVEWFREGVNAIWTQLKDLTLQAFEAVKAAVLTAMDAVVGFVKEKMAQVLAFWQENGAEITQAAQNVWNFIRGIIEAVLPVITAIIKGAWMVIQLIITSVWENIKGVINGALNVIMGLIKTFSGLFTGNWKGMWDGIKQMFGGAIEFLLNAVQLMLWGKLIKGVIAFAGTFKATISAFWATVKNLFTTSINGIKASFTAGFNAMKSSGTSVMNAIKNVITTVWSAIKAVFTITINAIKSFFTSGFNAMRNTASTVMNGIKSLISSVWNGIKSTITNAVNAIKNAVSNGFSGVANAVRTKMAEAVSAVASKMTEMLGKVTGKASAFLSAGKDLVRGLINGITAMGTQAIGAITGVVDGVVNKAKSLLGIKSPSRVFIAIGKHTGQGFANGIADMKGVVTASIKGLTNVIQNVTKQSTSEINAIHRKQAADEKKIIADKNRSIANIYAQARAKKRKLTVSETQRIAKIESDAKSKLVANERKHAAEITKIQATLAKDKLAAIKQYVEDKKSTEELSLVAESEIWRRSLAQFKAGSKERVEAQKQYQVAVEAVNKEVTAINQEYADKMQKINDDLAKSEHDLNAEYNKAYSDRVSAITGFANTFDEFVSKFEGTGQTLLDNLQSQVTGLQDWRSVLDSLWGKIDDQALMEELEAMGPKALGELQALNGMSEQQLTQYVALYNQKFALARDQAAKELAGMKEDTADRITAMRETANAELEKLRTEWAGKITSLTKVTNAELMTLKDIGKNAGKGLMDGLASMEPALVAKATSIANSIKAAMASAFDIHSPSRWMRDFIGVNMMRGWIDGMASMQSRVIAMSGQATDWMTPAVPQVAGYTTPTGGSKLGRAIQAPAQTGNNATGGVTQHITINSPTALSPAETARKQKQAAQQLALEWRTR